MVRELYTAGHLGKQRVIGTDTHILAWLNLGAALAHDDGAAGNNLAGKGLYAKPLCI